LTLSLLVFALVAQSAPGAESAAFAQVVSEGATVVVRGNEQDDATREQVVRVLPAAVAAASRFGALPADVVLTLHATHAGLEAATGRDGTPWMRAWARPGRVDLQSPRTWSHGRASDRALVQILTHELTHCVLFRAAGGGEARAIPHWFTEGMASTAAGERHDLADPSAIAGPGPGVRARPEVVYGTADRAFRELVRAAGDGAIRRILAALSQGRTFHAAFHDAVGTSLESFEGDVSVRLSSLAAR
jgi:hypothetical protein